MHYMFAKFGVNSLSRFPFRVRTLTCRQTATDDILIMLTTHRLSLEWVNTRDTIVDRVTAAGTGVTESPHKQRRSFYQVKSHGTIFRVAS